MFTVVKGHRACWGSWKKKSQCTILAEKWSVSSWEPASPSFRVWSVNWLKSKKWLRDCNSMFSWFKLDLYSLNPELYKVKQEFSRLPIYLLLGKPWSVPQGGELHYSDHCSDSVVCHCNHVNLAFGNLVSSWSLPPESQWSPLQQCLTRQHRVKRYSGNRVENSPL